jgi:hypothetical protein
MRVTVRLGEPTWRIVGQRQVALEAPGDDCSLPELVERLTAAYPALGAEFDAFAAATRGDPLTHLTFFERDRIIPPADWPTRRIPDGSEVMIMLPMAGG